MARLIVMGTQELEISNLGRNKSLYELSEKRITKAVRAALREKYGFGEVEVSCAAVLSRGRVWTGRCCVRGIETSYQLMAGLYD